jgi:cell division protein FtsL
MKHETKQFNKLEEVLLLAVQVVVSMIAFLLRG